MKLYDEVDHVKIYLIELAAFVFQLNTPEKLTFSYKNLIRIIQNCRCINDSVLLSELSTEHNILKIHP